MGAVTREIAKGIIGKVGLKIKRPGTVDRDLGQVALRIVGVLCHFQKRIGDAVNLAVNSIGKTPNRRNKNRRFPGPLSDLRMNCRPKSSPIGKPPITSPA